MNKERNLINLELAGSVKILFHLCINVLCMNVTCC